MFDSRAYLKSLVQQVLNESTVVDDVVDSIKKRYEVVINYKPENGKGGGKRVIQPVAYGTSKSGNLVVRAFQPYGDTKTKIPHWKLFRLDRILSWKGNKRKKFTEPPQTQFSSAEGKFNNAGDDSMSQVFLVANFDNSRYLKSGLKAYNDERHRQAVERNKYHDLTKNIKNSSKLGDVDYIKKNLELWQKSQASRDFKSNQVHSDEMRRSANFNTPNYSTTNEPVTKNNYQDNAYDYDEEPEVPNYDNVSDNGPVRKQPENRTVDYDTDNTHDETGERKNILKDIENY